MKLPDAAHTSRPWRIHEIARDFDLLDVWALPTPGGPDDFPRLVELVAEFDPAKSSSALVRALFAIRWKVGEVLGWDDEEGFTPMYEAEDEWAAEVVNRTVHGILHVGWVPDGGGGFRGQLAILVRRHGLLGAAYVAAIGPFRHLVVYPTLMRELGREWEARSATLP